ncbi:MAG TPA: hypothetical protein VJC10_01770 [Patescibacteria group bacterium]|nr:hypothetical protein [Patescibacteria group bacterium]
MTSPAENLQTIIIPRKDTTGYEDRVFLVTPITDAWLVSPDRTWDEVDSILSGRLKDTEQEFQFEKHPTPLAKKYGLERPASKSMARFLAYVEMFDEYNDLEDSYSSHADSLRTEFDTERDEIKRTTKGQGKKIKRIQDAWKGRYNPAIETDVEETDKAKQVQELILRKAVLDFFSVRNTTDDQPPLISDTLPRLVNEAQELSTSMRPGVEGRERQAVLAFVSKLSEFLQNTSDTGLFTRYSYRFSSDIVTTQVDCHVLNSAIGFMLDKDASHVSSSITQLMERMGGAYISFLKKRAVYLSQSQIQEKYPYLSLIYDILSASFYRGQHTILQNLDRVLDPYLSDVNHSPFVSREISHLTQEWEQHAHIGYQAMENKRKHMHPTNDPDELIKKRIMSDPQIVGYSVSGSRRLLNGLVGVFSTLHDKALEFEVDDSTVINYVGRQLRESVRGSSLGRQAVIYERYLSTSVDQELYEQKGIETDLVVLSIGQVPRIRVDEKFALVRRNQPLFTMDDIIEDTPTRIAKLQQAHKEAYRMSPTVREANLFQYYIIHFLRDSGKNIEHVERENNFLWHEVLNNPTWFVSPRGDRYRAAKDTELSERAIDSVSFHTDKGFPREHRVLLKLTGIDEPLVFWLDTHRNLIGSDRQVLPVDPVLKQAFVNLLLKRLYYITSGLLSSDEIEIEHGDGTRMLDYKRAHYRHLESTTERPITMESHGAQVHAREVLEDYNIDIFAEIRRRRGIGTLKPNGYITFVREVTPREVAGLVLPNDLRYDPEKVEISV